MARKLIIDGNAVYEIDEECMLKHRLEDIGDKMYSGGKDHNPVNKGKDDQGSTYGSETMKHRG